MADCVTWIVDYRLEIKLFHFWQQILHLHVLNFNQSQRVFFAHRLHSLDRCHIGYPPHPDCSQELSRFLGSIPDPGLRQRAPIGIYGVRKYCSKYRLPQGPWRWVITQNMPFGMILLPSVFTSTPGIHCQHWHWFRFCLRHPSYAGVG